MGRQNGADRKVGGAEWRHLQSVVMRSSDRQLNWKKYLRMMQSQQEAANCDPTKSIAAKNNQRLQILKNLLAGGTPMWL